MKNTTSTNKKRTGKLAVRLTALIMAAISIGSVATVGITGASAAETSSYSVVYNDAEKEVASIVYNAFAKKAVDMLKDLAKKVPMGDVAVEIFENIYGLLTAEEPKPDTVSEKINSVYDIVNKISLSQDAKTSSELAKFANNMKNFCENAYGTATDDNLENLINTVTQAKRELVQKQAELEAMAGSVPEECKKIEAEIEKLNATLVESNKKIDNWLKQICDGNTFEVTLTNLYDELTKSVKEKNAFITNFDTNFKTLHFGKLAKDESQKYEDKVLKSYVAGVTLYLTLLDLKSSVGGDNKNINNCIARVQKQCQEVFDNYNNNILPYENEKINNYYLSGDTDKEITIGGIGTAECKKGCINYTGTAYQNSLIRYLDGSDRTCKYDEYMSNIREMLSREFSGNQSLREFLKSKGYEIPARVKYLFADMSENVYFEHVLFRVTLKVYDLDKSCNTPERIDTANRISQYSSLKYNDFDNLGYFYIARDSVKTDGGADIICNGKTVHYDNIEDAWNDAMTYYGATVKLYEDWSPKNGSADFGTGAGFKNGAIYVSRTVTLDLNGHRIDRKLTAARDDGSVIITSKYSSLYLVNTASDKGVITGGFTTGKGGGIFEEDSGTVLGNYGGVKEINNCIITGNRALKDGGGVYLSEFNNGCLLKNCEISNNSSSSNGGGLFARVSGFFTAEVKLDGKVVIRNNLANNRNNNLTLDENSCTKATLTISSLSSGSYIGINSTTSDRWLRITENNDNIKSYKSYFEYDNSSYRIEISGKHLEIDRR